MVFRKRWLAALASALLVIQPGAHAQAIESELVLITPVAKALTDAALADFVAYAKERWGVTLRATAIAAGTPVAYGRILEWNGRPEVDIFWGGESALYDKLAARSLIVKLDLPAAVMDAIPPTLGKPKPIPLKDANGYWTGTVLEPYGLVYHPKLLQRLGVPPPQDWDDLLHPRLKGQVAQCAPSRSSSSHATYEVILQRDGDEQGWAWLKRLGANTGIFTARSRDVSSVVARGEFAAGFAVPSYMAFEDKLSGHDIRFVAPKTAWVTPEPIAILAGARNPKAAKAFIEYLLSERGQRVAMERGVFPITPRFRLEGEPGSGVEKAVEFTGGVRSYFDVEVVNIYDDDKAQQRYERVNEQFRKQIEAVWSQLRK